MQLTFPNKVAWRRYIDSNPYFASTRKSNRLANFLKKIKSANISYTIVDLNETEGFYEWFNIRYRAMLADKANPLAFDVASYTLSDGRQPAQKCALLLREKGELIGATIFFAMRQSLNIAFKTYPFSWQTDQVLQIGPSLYAEYLLYEHAKRCRKDFISSGVDRNLYGVHADIGLATFKFSAGYNPRSVAKPEYTTIEQSSINKDTLVFLSETDQAGFLTKAKLFTADPDRYTMLLKSTKHTQIETIQL